MEFFQNQRQASTSSVTYDEGLRSFMIKIYNYMAGALLLTGIVALVAASSPEIMGLMYNIQGGRIVSLSAIGWIVALSPILMVFVFSRMQTMKTETAQLVFWIYSGLMGLSLSSLFYIYTGESLARVFFITASVFGAASLYGYSSKSDLTKLGSFMMIGLIGIVIASIISIFLKSSGLSFAISLLSVVIFTGLTAYETQKFKAMYDQIYSSSPDSISKIAIIGALNLYMNFINLFINLLNLIGQRRD